jgi:hypothetical protein
MKEFNFLNLLNLLNLVNSEPDDEVCDARDDDSSTTAGYTYYYAKISV